MNKKLLTLSCIEGATVMAAELCGAKLLSPIFGSSLYVWASVMGITLGALASGYFYGGYISNKKNVEKKLFQVLTVAALFVLLMPVISHYLIPRISYLPFLSGVVIGTFVLLFSPIFFLGASSPLFIVLQVNNKNPAGKVSGTVYAVSTAGGIFATFLCGFYLIPQIGLSFCLLSFGLIMLIASLLIFKIFKPTIFLLAGAFIYLNLQFTLKKSLVMFQSESILGHLEILDLKLDSGKTSRVLKINNIIQTEMDVQTKQSTSDYIKLFDSNLPKSATKREALILGLGGGLLANQFIIKNYQVDGVEFDERIIDAAKKYFYLNENVKTFSQDARYFLNHCKKKYHIIVFDVFKAEEQPSHIITKESLEKVKTLLNNDGKIYINWHGYTNDQLGKGTSVLYNTLKNSGFYVRLCALSNNESHRNVICICSLAELPKIPCQIYEKLANIPNENTDDLQILEKYNALANITWRNNYLRFYQNNK
jgi:spermidine synthase